MKEVFCTKVLKNELIAKGIYSMILEYHEEIACRIIPGQFVNLYLNRKDLLLPRPLSICRVLTESINIVYRISGSGTKELSCYLPGALIRVSSPLGNGFDLSICEKDVKPKASIVGGGIGVPPLLELTHHLVGMGVSVQAVLGFQDEPYLYEEFQKAGAAVRLATDSGKTGFRGTVMDLIKDETSVQEAEERFLGEICFACGPSPMLSALSGHCIKTGTLLQVSLEERMGCGFGACVGCVCKIKTSDGAILKKVCKDGPVFPGNEVVFDA